MFLINCKVSLKFNNLKKLQTNLLKAPSRHKKFFHQIYFEIFSVNVFFLFEYRKKVPTHEINNIFLKVNDIFLKIGSNTLTRTKFIMCTYFCGKEIFKL